MIIVKLRTNVGNNCAACNVFITYFVNIKNRIPFSLKESKKKHFCECLTIDEFMKLGLRLTYVKP